MPKIPDNNPESDIDDSVADNLKPYIFHGLDLNQKKGDKEAIGDCPFCGKSNKFSVDVKTSKFKCWSCNESGNSTTFLRKLYEESQSGTQSDDLVELAKERGFISFETLLYWGVVKSSITDDWLVPGYGTKGEINNLYRYGIVGGKKRLLSTPSLHHQIHGMDQYHSDKETVFICEGPWDGMALWEIMFKTKVSEEGMEETANIENNLLKDSNVIAIPGCNVFKEQWAGMFEGKIVNIMFDNDHPRTNPKNGKVIVPAGYAGMKRLAGILSGSKTPPRQINFLRWGDDLACASEEGTEGIDLSLPSGCDLRDYLSDSINRKKGSTVPASLGVRRQRLGEIFDRIHPVPEELLLEPATASGKGVKIGNLEEEGGLECLPCTDYKSLINSWKKAMKWTEGLECALSVMLASVTSTMSVGDQLWLKILGPPASGKSTLCEALSVNKRFILAKSTIRGFHSGWKGDPGEDGEEKDTSLASKARGKTLVIKDGDTLLQAPNLGQILSEARDIYDRTSRTDYRNSVSRNYEGLSMTWILCGTAALRLIDSSELGARFLDCTIMEGIDSEFEDDVLYRVAHRTDRNLAIETDADPSTQQDPDLTEAMQLTGGYITHLRENAQDLLGQVVLTDKGIHTCIYLGKFVAFMRARPALDLKRIEDTATREFATRLVSQLVRLAKCMAVVMNRKVVDAEVLKRTRKVALDTARGITFQIAKRLYDHPEGLDSRSIAVLTIQPEETTRKMMRFLAQIEFVEPFTKSEKGTGVKSKPRWRLRPEIRELLSNVLEDFTDEEKGN